jgi:hypothetical protein
VHQPAEERRRLGVARGVAPQLVARLVRVGPPGEVVAAVERGDGALEGKDLEPVARELEVADDLRAQQAHDVGEHRELEAGEDLLGDRRAADERALLEDERAPPRARQVGGGDEPVVPPADDDRVVRAAAARRPVRLRGRGRHARFRSGS